MTDWDDRARRLIELARAGHDPSPARKRHLTTALIARCVADPTLAAASTAALGAKGAAGVSAAAKLGLGVLGLPLWGTFAVGASAGALTAASLYYAQQSLAPAAPARHDTEPVAVVATAPATPQVAAAPAASARPALTPPELAARGVSVERSAVPPKSESLAASPSGLEIELQGLRRAQRLLHRGDATAALVELDVLDRAGATGALFEERLATRALAECALGRGARTSAEFVRLFPVSVHLGRVTAACRPVQKSYGPLHGSVGTPTQGVEETEP
jgi:hypothetical protein